MTLRPGFKVRYVNHGYSGSAIFDTVTEALNHAKSVHFEAAIERTDGRVVATWSPLYGTSYVRPRKEV